MKATELIKLLQDEVVAFGDVDVVTYCPRHSGDEGTEPVGIAGIGWHGNTEKNMRATFINCEFCDEEALQEHIEGKYGLPGDDEPPTMEEFDL